MKFAQVDPEKPTKTHIYITSYSKGGGVSSSNPIHLQDTGPAEVRDLIQECLEGYINKGVCHVTRRVTETIHEDQACQGKSCGAAPLGCSDSRYCPKAGEQPDAFSDADVYAVGDNR